MAISSITAACARADSRPRWTPSCRLPWASTAPSARTGTRLATAYVANSRVPKLSPGREVLMVAHRRDTAPG